MKEITFPLTARTLAGVMPADLSGPLAGYLAAGLRTLGPRRISPPAIPGNNPLAPPEIRFGQPCSADGVAGIDGVFPECVAYLPSTSRWASPYRSGDMLVEILI